MTSLYRFIFNCIMILIPAIALGQATHKWVRTNPGGGGAFSTVEAGPTGQIIAGSDLSGAYYSWDFGQSWNVYGAERGLFSTHVSGLGFHPTDEQIFFIGTDAGIYRSTNGGGYLSQVLASGYITDIQVAPSNPSICYATHHSAYNQADGKIYKSTDTGATWSAISIDLPAGYHLLEIQISSSDPNDVYVLTGNGRFVCTPAHLFRSTNGGAQWTRVADAVGQIMDFAIHPSDPDSIYLSTMEVDCSTSLYYTSLAGKLYLSADGGTTWHVRAQDRTGIIWIKRDAPQIIRMIDPREPWPWIPSGGTWRSTDSGLSWVKISDGNWDSGYQSSLAWAYGTSYNGFCKTLGESMAEPDVLFWTNTQWIFATHDEGVNFNNLHTKSTPEGTWQSTGFDNVVMNELATSADHQTIYISFADLGIWRSLDRGASWQSCNRSDLTGNWQGFGGNSLTILADPHRTSVVWANIQGDLSETAQLVKSSNHGSADSWIISQSGLPGTNRISGLSLDPNSPSNNRTLYVTADGSVYKSTDDGATWSLVKSDGALHFTAVDAINSQIVYAGGRNGIHRSLNGGNTWADLSDPGMKGVLDVDYFAFGYQGVSSICTDPLVEGKVYITVFGPSGGAFVRELSGTTWSSMYANPQMRSMVVNPQNNQQIYAGSSSAYYAGSYQNNSLGVLFSNDRGTSWQTVNGDMPWPFATTFAFDQASPHRIYVGSPGTGVQYAYVGGSHCEHHQLISGQISGNFTAVEEIETQGSVVVLNDVTLQATQCISLNPQFEVPIGHALTVNTDLCSSGNN